MGLGGKSIISICDGIVRIHNSLGTFALTITPKQISPEWVVIHPEEAVNIAIRW